MKAMLSYKDFILKETTEQELRDMGASDVAIARLKEKQRQRGKGFATGDDRVPESEGGSGKMSGGQSRAALKGRDMVKQKALPPARNHGLDVRRKTSGEKVGEPATSPPPRSQVTGQRRPPSPHMDKEAIGQPKQAGQPGVRQSEPESGGQSNKRYSEVDVGEKDQARMIRNQNRKPDSRGNVKGGEMMVAHGKGTGGADLAGSQAQKQRDKILGKEKGLEGAGRALGSARKGVMRVGSAAWKAHKAQEKAYDKQTTKKGADAGFGPSLQTRNYGSSKY